MKTINKIVLFSLIVFASVAIASCSNSLSGGGFGTGSGGGSGTGTITISLGTNGSLNLANGRAAVWPPSPADLSTMEYFIELKGPTSTINDNWVGSSTKNYTVAVGLWKICIEAWSGGTIYATGSNSVEVKTGQKNTVKIILSPPLLPPPDGSAANPFLVKNAADLLKVGTGSDGWDMNKCYKQVNNINMSGIAFSPIGMVSSEFTGVYDGDGKTISNLSISSGSSNIGLFCYIGVSGGAAGTVKNLGLLNLNILGIFCVGGIAGQVNSGKVENCYTTGTVTGTGNSIGGIAGSNNSGGTIKNCYSTANVNESGGGGAVGGIVGHNNGGAVENCYATGNIDGSNNTGGVVGSGSFGLIKLCVALNQRVYLIPNAGDIGRVAGYINSTTLTNNHSRNDMLIAYNAGSAPLMPYNPTPGLNFKDGANVSVGAGGYNDQTFWSSLGWDFTNIWAWSTTKNLPILRGLAGQ